MLLDILTELSQELGRDLSVATDRTWLLTQINHAAQELYNSDDITGCEHEQILVLGQTDQQIVLPWYVGHLIGVRRYEFRDNIQQVDMRPRYARSGWKKPFQQYPYFQWRQKGKVALSRNLTDEAALTVSLPEGTTAAETFTVTIVGSNSQSARVRETVTFAAGERTKTTEQFFSDVLSIIKSRETTYDLVVTDVAGNEVSSIPSHMRSAMFNLVQVLDRNEQQSQSQLVEILFKQQYEPYVSDTDVFTPGAVYEKVVYWKTLEHCFAKLDGKEDKAAMCGNKAQAVLANILANQCSQLEMAIDFGRNPTLECFQRSRYGAWLARNYPGNSSYAGPYYS
ncbi:MAG: hypothetical protein EBS84_20180 [Proteobacteria bacterium]|nr:hypothetical protein [Verrucomicrobiota bacterium]NBU11299.1 hypothetical protein [Pseudomonadota bacterium]